jgi:ethanolaminephosphotransferase
MEARRARGQRARHALKGLVPFFLAWILIVSYLALQSIVLYHHLIPFVFFVGIINAYSVGQMITAHLTKARFPYYNVLLLPLLYGVIDSLGPALQRKFGFGWPSALGNDVYQVAFVFCCLGLAIGTYGSFVIDVITTICDYLDIWCLTIKHPYVEPTEEKKGK